jgi:hypothetical protein
MIPVRRRHICIEGGGEGGEGGGEGGEGGALMHTPAKMQLTHSGRSTNGLRLCWYVVQMRALRADSLGLTGSSSFHRSSALKLPIKPAVTLGCELSSRSTVFGSQFVLPSYRTAM